MILPDEIRNDDSEKSVLSCIFIDNSLLALSSLESKNFYNPVFARVYSAMQKLFSEDKEIDTPLIFQLVSDVCSMDDLFDIVSYSLTAGPFEDHCAVVLENYNRREMRKKAQSFIASCEDKSVAYNNLVDQALTIPLTQEVEVDNKLIPGVIETVEKLFDKKESLMVSETTGYKDIDTMISGWRAGSLYIIGARPSVGKSTFAINLALKAGKMGYKTALFSTEMPPHEIHIRMLSNLARVDSRMIEKGEDSISSKITDAVDELSKYADCSVYKDFNSNSLERLISKEVAKGAKIMFVDYLQNIKVEGKHNNRNDAIGAITAMLKQQALKHNITIVCLAQLNRQLQEGQEPELAHLRDSGNIEQDADVVMFLHGFDEHMKEISVAVKKNRHGELGTVLMTYIKPHFLFLNKY